MFAPKWDGLILAQNGALGNVIYLHVNILKVGNWKNIHRINNKSENTYVLTILAILFHLTIWQNCLFVTLKGSLFFMMSQGQKCCNSIISICKTRFLSKYTPLF